MQNVEEDTEEDTKESRTKTKILKGKRSWKKFTKYFTA